MHGFQLSDISVQGAKVNFAMAGIPGDPKFAGKLDADKASMSGDFSQSGQTLPFKLERKAKTPEQGETPAKGVPGKGLIGHWQGNLAISEAVSWRLILEITNSPGESLSGVLRSVDQGNAIIPITTLTFKEGAVHLEARSVNGVFDGKMSGDGSEISGHWSQGSGSKVLVFKRLKKAPEFTRDEVPEKPSFQAPLNARPCASMTSCPRPRA